MGTGRCCDQGGDTIPPEPWIGSWIGSYSNDKYYSFIQRQCHLHIEIYNQTCIFALRRCWVSIHLRLLNSHPPFDGPDFAYLPTYIHWISTQPSPDLTFTECLTRNSFQPVSCNFHFTWTWLYSAPFSWLWLQLLMPHSNLTVDCSLTQHQFESWLWLQTWVHFEFDFTPTQLLTATWDLSQTWVQLESNWSQM